MQVYIINTSLVNNFLVNNFLVNNFLVNNHDFYILSIDISSSEELIKTSYYNFLDYSILYFLLKNFLVKLHVDKKL